MKLTHKQLQTLAKTAREENKTFNSLCEEIREAFGLSVLTEGSVSDVAWRVNHHLDAMSSSAPTFKVSTLIKYTNHPDPEVRKMTARLLPERYAVKLKDDCDSRVRCAVAQKVSPSVLFEMCKKNPDDDQLRVIRKERVLKEGLDLDAAQKLSKASQKTVVVELSDEWYLEAARKILNDYGEFTYGTPRALEHAWNPLAVKMYCDATYLTSGVRIDQKKLQDAVDEMITALEAGDPLYKGTLNDLLKNLTETVKQEKTLNETKVFEVYVEPEENSLLTNSYSSHEYVQKFEETFNVKKAVLPAAIKKYRLGETLDESIKIPAKVSVGRLDENIEKSLDKYVSSWNNLQAMRGEPFKINWSVDPTDCTSVCFDMELK